MQASLTSFLLKCDPAGQILEVYWHQPAFLISPFQKHLPDLFIESDQALIHKLMRQALQTTDVLVCHQTLRLRSPQTSVSVCFMAVGKQILTMGLDAEFLDEDETGNGIKYIIHEFMKLIRMTGSDMTGKSEKTIRLQFEQLQKLNNQLLNTQRALSQANAELSRLNSYLNNRLVRDELTGLVSRYQYRSEIELRIREQPHKLGVFTFIDIDHFKQINDTYGHRAGDVYLKTFTRRLQEVEYGNKICMRISGDEVGLYLHGFTSVEAEDISHIWQEIEMKILSTPADIEGTPLVIRCSAGMAVYGVDTDEIYDLIEYADFAMYQVKSQGKNTFRRFDKGQYRKEKG